MSRSVFVKINLVVVATGLLIYGALFFGMRSLVFPRRHEHPGFQRALSLYAANLQRDIGDPPDPSRLSALVQETGFQIRVDTPSGHLATEDDLPSWQEIQRQPKARPSLFSPPPPPPGQTFGFYQHRPYLHVARDNYDYVFFAPEGAQPEARPDLLLEAFLAIACALLLSYLALRYVLRPIRSLSDGVDALTAGDLAYRVAVSGHDELAELGRSFNEMAGRLSGMLAAREQLLIDVSHELRSPVGRMKLALELQPESKGRERLSRNLAEIERLVSEILEAAKTNVGDEGHALATVDLASILSEGLKGYGDAPVRFELRTKTPVPVAGDAGKLWSVARNLLENALKYSDPAGPPVVMTLAVDAEGVLLTVEDHGVGIPSAELERVFEPFYRVDKSRSKETGGYGLGLSLCRKIVQAHGGRIRLDSRVGQGTTATVRLPLLTDAKTAAQDVA